MVTSEIIRERAIAQAAAYILRESFIEAASNGKVLYVENGILWSKTPDGQPVFFKNLTGRNPNLSKTITDRRIFKIKKRHNR